MERYAYVERRATGFGREGSSKVLVVRREGRDRKLSSKDSSSIAPSSRLSSAPRPPSVDLGLRASSVYYVLRISSLLSFPTKKSAARNQTKERNEAESSMTEASGLENSNELHVLSFPSSRSPLNFQPCSNDPYLFRHFGDPYPSPLFPPPSSLPLAAV